MTSNGQLIVGIVAFLLWNGTVILWLRGRPLGNAGRVALVVAFEVALIILVAGSLRLLDSLSDPTWFLIGTLGRFVVALAGLVALVSTTETR